MNTPIRWRCSAVVAIAALAALAPRPSEAHHDPFALLAAAAPTTAGTGAAALVWCGDAATSVDRKPDEDTWAQQQLHVLYATPADAEDRFDVLASAIVRDVGAIDDWWHAQDPSRAPRWDRFAFPGCDSRAGSLDLLSVRLPKPTSAYRNSDRIDVLVEDLLTIVGPLEKSLVYYDGERSEGRICGQSEIAPLYAGRLGFSFVFLQSTCTGDLGEGGVAAVTAAHELAHSLGAVQLEGPPNRCRDASRVGHVCDTTDDLMFPYATGLGLRGVALDVGRDDYYAHSGTWWDVQDSAWLTRFPQRRLTVIVHGRAGAGSVRSDPLGIDCGSSCDAVLDDGIRVTLAASAAPGSRLWSWEGPCAGWAPRCSFALGDATTAVATFGPNRYRVAVRLRGRGAVASTPAGITCRSSCGAWFPPDSRVRLRPVAVRGWRFAGWTGACRGRGGCLVTADRDVSVTATFARR